MQRKQVFTLLDITYTDNELLHKTLEFSLTAEYLHVQ